MKKTLTALSIFVSTISAMAAPSTIQVKSVYCNSFVKDYDGPRNIINLVQQNDGAYQLYYAHETNPYAPSLQPHDRRFNCVFAAENPKIFSCESTEGGGLLYSLITTQTHFAVNWGVRDTKRISVVVPGPAGKPIGSDIKLLEFNYEDDCRVSQ